MRNASTSAGRGDASGSIHAPVCVMVIPSTEGGGSSAGSVASQGRSVTTCRSTSSIGPRPRRARFALTRSSARAFHARQLSSEGRAVGA
ncbi:MAG: hypothetical protein U0414_42020 [Polyangiaceae bacterium]